MPVLLEFDSKDDNRESIDLQNGNTFKDYLYTQLPFLAYLTPLEEEITQFSKSRI